MSTETTSSLESPRIDHFCRLPNELLEDIFDHAYSTSPPPLMPISKRLLPFHRKHLYRQVTLSSSSRVKEFLTSVSNDTVKVQIVKTIKLDGSQGGVVIESIGALEHLFPILVNVRQLDLQALIVKAGSRSKKLFSSLTKVTTVSIEATLDAGDVIDLNDFGFLSTLPSLDTLKVLDWPMLEWESDEEEEFSLAGVKNLCVEGKGAEDESVIGLVKLCPALLHVELVTTYDGETSFACSLPDLPSTLISLKLAATNLTSDVHPVDHLLLRFTNLRSLDLDDGCYLSAIHSILQQLPLLEKICLGGGVISPTGFINLLSGPTRLVHLRTLVLDFYVGERGVRTDIAYEIPPGPDMEDWEKPRASAKGSEDHVFSGASLQFDQLRQLIRVARDGGIRIRGNVHEALRNLEDYWIEQNNRAVLSIYRKRHDGLPWKILVDSCAKSAGVDLPAFDADSVEQEGLELVRTVLPERDWFIFSLKDKVEAKEQVSEDEEDVQLG